MSNEKVSLEGASEGVPPSEHIWISKDRAQATPTDWLPFWFKEKKYDDDIEYVRARVSPTVDENPHETCLEQDAKRQQTIQRLVNATGEETVIAALSWIQKRHSPVTVDEVADKNSVSGAGDCSSKEARLVQAYESKVQDFARETLRSSEAIAILQDVDKYLEDGTHDIATGHPKEKWGKQCKWCDVRQRIAALISQHQSQGESKRAE